MSIHTQRGTELRGQGLEATTLQGLLDASYGEDTIPEGWKKDKNLSTNQNKVFVGPNNQAVVAHRGTTGTMQDWSNNLAYGLGGLNAYKRSGRYKKAEQVQRSAEAQYGDVITIGHSQGGLLAQELGQGEVITLNKATRPGDAWKRKPPQQTDVRSSLDVVSVMGNKRGNVTIPAITRNPIAEHGTDVLERMEDAFIGLRGNGSTTSKRREQSVVNQLPYPMLPHDVPLASLSSQATPQLSMEQFEDFLEGMTFDDLQELQQELAELTVST